MGQGEAISLLVDHENRLNRFLDFCQKNSVPRDKEVPEATSRRWGDTRNRTVTKGRFTAKEDELLKMKLQEYFDLQGVSWDDGFKALIRRKFVRRKGGESPWVFIGSALPNRHLESVVIHVQASLYPWKERNKRWSEKQKEELVALHDLYGDNWVNIGLEIGRHFKHCRDQWHYLNELNKLDELRKSGTQRLEGGGTEEGKAEVANTPEVVNDDVVMFEEGESGWSMLHKDAKDIPTWSSPIKPMRVYGEPVQWTPEEDEAILDKVREISKVFLPLHQIPWLYVGKCLAPFFAEPRSHESIRERYLYHIFPRIARPFIKTRIIRRCAIRHITRQIKHSKTLHYTEVNWANAVPYWPDTPTRRIVERVIRPYVTHKDHWKSGEWRNSVRRAYRDLRCKKHKHRDSDAVLRFLDNVRMRQGGMPKSEFLPHPGDKDNMHAEIRRQVSEMEAKLRKAEFSRVEEKAMKEAKDGSAEAYLEKRLEAFLGL